MALQTATGAERVDLTFNDAVAITPNDAISPQTRLRNVRGVWADVAGSLKVITQAVADQTLTETGGLPTAANAVTFTLPAGQPLPLSVAFVLATGTAATGIKAFY